MTRYYHEEPLRSHRSCTDIFWLILFFSFLGVWGFIGYYGIHNGNVERLLAPIDSQGRRCGLDSAVVDKKYLVFFDIAKCLSPNVPITGCPTPQVCVDHCPERSIILELEVRNESRWSELRETMVCTDEVDLTTLTAASALQYMQQDKCARYVLKSQPVLQRCVVAADEAMEILQSVSELGLDLTQVQEKLKYLFSLSQVSGKIVEDLVQSRWYLLGGLAAVVLLCMLYIVLLRWVVAPVVWVSILGLLALLCFGLYECYRNYVYYKNNPVSLGVTTNASGYFLSLFKEPTPWMVLLVVLAVILVVLTLIVIFLRKRITLAISLIKEGSKAVNAVKSTMAFPIFPWAVQCLVIAYAVVVLVYLLSVGQSSFQVVNLTNDTSCDCKGNYTKDYESCDPAVFTAVCRGSDGVSQCAAALCHFTGIENPAVIKGMLAWNVVGFFWLFFFIGGLAEMILAGAFSAWYWTSPKRDLPFFTLTASIYRTLRYHMGTVALGSLIITIVRVIRVILEYIDRKLKKFDNPFTRGILCCCKCFFYCLENFLKFINKNAYIMCAVHGGSFCKSAQEAFSLITRNIVRVVVLDKVTDFVFFLSKLLISIGVGIGVYYLMEWNYMYDEWGAQRLNYNVLPAAILTVATYLVSSIFFNVYSMAVDTLFLCFLEDSERNDGSAGNPYYMSDSLKRILGR